MYADRGAQGWARLAVNSFQCCNHSFVAKSRCHGAAIAMSEGHHGRQWMLGEVQGLGAATKLDVGFWHGME